MLAVFYLCLFILCSSQPDEDYVILFVSSCSTFSSYRNPVHEGGVFLSNLRPIDSPATFFSILQGKMELMLSIADGVSYSDGQMGLMSYIVHGLQPAL